MPVAALQEQHSMQLALQEPDLFALPFISRDSRNLGSYEEHPFRTDPELID